MFHIHDRSRMGGLVVGGWVVMDGIQIREREDGIKGMNRGGEGKRDENR